MGQKVNPVGLRLGVNRTWDSRWFAGRAEYGRLLHQDMKMREHIMQQRRHDGLRVQFPVSADFRDSDGVRNIGFAGFADLAQMHLI